MLNNTGLQKYSTYGITELGHNHGITSECLVHFLIRPIGLNVN